MGEKMIAMREAFGQALVDLAEKIPEMLVLDADVSTSTKTLMFGSKYPERFFNVGVAEANMVDIAGGMSTCGLKPVVSTFAIFISLKCAEQVRSTICYNNLPVVLAGGYAGVSDSFDGASHQSLIDIAVLRAMPNLTIVVPGDPTEVPQALEQALNRGGPTYIRLSRNPSPVLFDDEEPFQAGKIRTIKTGGDITIAVCGVPTFIAIEASEKLEQLGISVDLLEVSTVKPIDVETLVQSVSKTGKIMTVEEHNVHGGLGSAIAEVLSKSCPAKIDLIGVEDIFTETGQYMDLLKEYGISVENIINRAKAIIG